MPSTQAEPGLTRGHVRAIPQDVLKEASRRLGIMSFMASVLWLSATAIDHALINRNPVGNMSNFATDVIAAVAVIVSLALFFYTRRQDLDPAFTLNLGLVYMLFTALALGLTFHWYPVGNRPVEPMITWIGALVLMSAAIVPNSPKKTLVAGLIAVSMNPISMLIARARGTWHFHSVSDVLVMHYPDFMLVGVSVVISIVVTRLGQHVAKAREMGSYQLLTPIGKGGMGEVWRARHRMLARDAAIKLIQPEVLSRNSGSGAAMMRRRFEQEAKATASLRSPHTVALYDYGVTDAGVFYYVMELLDGIDLETLVKQFGPLPPARVVHILKQLCRSLGEAHRQGMIHRDIKPTNIFLCRMGSEYDFTKVLDFGLVKVMDREEAEMTVVGSTLGTPAHMAPELALGKPNIDGRTDLYGVGCVAYWLVTGRPVFEASNSSGMMLAHLNNTPVRPSERLKAAVPPSLEKAIMMCLAKEPAQRPASTEALVRLISSADDVGSWTSETAETWWRANIPDGVVVNSDHQAVAASPSAFSTV